MTRLNVGGRRYDVAWATLQRAAYFRCSRHFAGVQDGRVLFVDRDGSLFKHVLSWMRTGQRPPEHVVEKYKSQLIEECGFFGLPDLELNLLGQSCEFDLRPEDRAVRVAARRGHDGVHDVFSSDCAPREPAELQVPLLFREGRRPQLQGTAVDFRARLAAFCGQALLSELQDLRLPGLLVAGGAVVGALTDTLAGDVDLFLTCPQADAITQLRAVIAAVQRSHAEAAGPKAAMLVTRSAQAVTIYRHGTKLPPVQIVLGLSAGVKEVLAGFDVDCCCVAFHLESLRVLATARGLRALQYGTCLVDTDHDSPSYCRRLEKYGLRGWRIGLPGLDELRIAPSLRLPHVLVQGMLVNVWDGEPCSREIRCAANGKAEVLTPSRTQQGRVVNGPARLYVTQLPAAEVHARLLYLGGDRVMLLHDVPPEPVSEDEDEGCSKTHLEAAVRILERNASEGGALRKKAAGEARGGTAPVAFVYDVANANSSLESLACVRDAARCRGLEAEDFQAKYGLPRELRFEAGIARKTLTLDWWHALYNRA